MYEQSFIQTLTIMIRVLKEEFKGNDNKLLVLCAHCKTQTALMSLKVYHTQRIGILDVHSGHGTCEKVLLAGLKEIFTTKI